MWLNLLMKLTWFLATGCFAWRFERHFCFYFISCETVGGGNAEVEFHDSIFPFKVPIKFYFDFFTKYFDLWGFADKIFSFGYGW